MFIISLYYIILALSTCIASKSNKEKEKPIADYFYYVPTDEGIVAHLRQYDMLWNIARVVNRTVRIVGFSSLHYPDVKNINLCQHFLLQKPIECVDDLPETVLSTNNCIFTGAQHTPQHYGFDPEMPVDKKFNYSTIECIAGPVSLESGVYPPMVRAHSLEEGVFSEKYYRLLPTIRNLLSIKEDSEYSMVHWRRGDQLLMRCPRPNHVVAKGREDHTVNCATVEVFYKKIAENKKLFCDSKSSKQLITYVATNEKNETQLNYLKSNKIKLFGDIHSGLQEQGIHLTTIEEFTIELILMCQATYVFAWGESSIHRFLYNCRSNDKDRKYNTIIDDQRGIKRAKDHTGGARLLVR